jgi:regulator of sigma E protease
MLAVLAPLIVFGLVIFIHELGHFIAAKLTGVYAPRFSVGFGPALIRRRHGETEYVLAALPLGGYVRMASRHDAESAFIEGGEETDGLKPGDTGYDPEAMMPFGPKPVPEHRWFESKSLVARLFIMIAGIVMNIVLAFVVFTTFNGMYGSSVTATRVVGGVHAPVSAPSLAQLHVGDTIIAVNGSPVHSWDDVQEAIMTTHGGTVSIRTQGGEARVPIGGAGQPTAEDVVKSIDYFIAPVIGQVLPGSPASQAGLRAGDTVSTIAGTPIRTWPELVERVSASANVALPFGIRRGGQAVVLTITPKPTDDRDPVTRKPRTVGRIGAGVTEVTVRQPLGAIGAVKAGARQTWTVATGVLDVVGKLLSREISPRELQGPIGITRASVAAGQSGLVPIFFLIAIISVNVAVLNLLPIPILDGGQILINVAEAVKGSAFSARTRENILRVGLVAILLIFAMSTYNDVVKLVKDVGGRLFG